MNFDTIKQYADRLKESTIQNLLKRDVVYQECCQLEAEQEKQYLSLHLTEKERAICNSLLMDMDTKWMEYATDCYLAGMIDAIAFYHESRDQ
ncbi:MAG: hypothetical protein ACLSX0_01410 [Anaerostipes caccae]|jgi:hypothetical protein